MRLRDFLDAGGSKKVFVGQTADFDALEPSSTEAPAKVYAINAVETAGVAGYLTLFEGQGAGAQIAENRIRRLRVAANGENTDAILPEMGMGWPVPTGFRIAISAGTFDIIVYYVHGEDGPEEVV